MKILIYGSVNIDYSYHVQKIVQPGETVHCTLIGSAPGGKGANQAYAAGRAASGKYNVFFAGKADHQADFIFEKMNEAGVSCQFVTYSDYGTGTAIIQVAQNGQNSILVCGNGNIHNEETEIDSVLANFEKGDCIILNGEINNLNYIIEKCSEKGMVIFFNPSPVTEDLKNLPLNKASYLIFNEVEGAFFTGLSQENDNRTVLNALMEKYPDSKIVLTMGANGVFYGASSDISFVPANKINAVDTTGCGDTFLGFFAVEIMKGKTPEEALTVATKAAGIAATRYGAMNSIPDYCEVSG